ncbi:helix-turn-helix domain-containing protein [Rhodococcus pyridinivorans]|uniref:Helix-turn-helix domain-containing protein n=1 Tax=Rhodococcus pyridinivorans TaxID=103816 RepID=A0A7M2XHH3_9NOCA|nr:helix-turn-helix domain-containing protein [Rhodococcus pyridinivorans]QOV97234.1 helix-turn-helix domain-containing protein [Rhodococcus pyridinivorans]
MSSSRPGLKFRWHRDFLASDLGKTAKLVGVRVWDYASGDGSNAHPGRAALSEDLGISLSTVDRALRECRESGWLMRTNESNSHPSRAWADVYALSFPDRSSPMTTDQGGDHSSPMTTDYADRSSNEEDRSSFEDGSPVTDDDPTDPLHQINFQEGGGCVSTEGDSAREDTLPLPETLTEQAEAAFGELFGEPPSRATPDAYALPRVPVIEEPLIDPKANPLAWIDNELPGGFRGTERAQAQERLDKGEHYVEIRWDLTKARNARPKIGQRRHRFIEPNSQTSQEATP